MQRKNKTTQKKQQGVVLLTCMVFLLVLLAMLRFTMTSAKVEEQKSGIDLEIMSARESAQSALKSAEEFIMQQGREFCTTALSAGGLGKSESECANDKAKSAGILFGNVSRLNHWISSKLGGKNKAGIYMIDDIAGCNPSWTCVNWSSNEAKDSASQISGTPKLMPHTVEGKAGQQEFIIERFLSNEELKNTPTDGKPVTITGIDTVVLRITALGTGFASADNPNSSRSIVQATYILPDAPAIQDFNP